MPLEVGDVGATEEDVVSCTDLDVVLLDLQFHDLGWMLDNLGDIGTVAGANFT